MATTFGLIAATPANPAIYQRGTREGTEGASQTFVKGEFLTHSSGYLIEYAGSGLISGIALEDAHNGSAGANRITYLPIRAGDEIYMSLADTIAQTDEGATYGVVVSSNKSVIDRDDTSDEVTILELTGLRENPFHAVAAIGDTNVVVKAVINAANHIDG